MSFSAVLVAFESRVRGRAALAAAAEMARAMGLPLRALYLEDERGHEIAGFAFAGTRAPRAGAEAVLRRALTRETARMRLACEATARAARLDFSFEVTRGDPASGLEAAATGREALVMPVDLDDPGLGLRARRAGRLAARGVAVLIAPEARQGEGPVLVLAGPEQSAARALGQRIAAGLGAPAVLAPPGDPPERLAQGRPRLVIAMAAPEAPEAPGEAPPEALIEAMLRRWRVPLLLVPSGVSAAPA